MNAKLRIKVLEAKERRSVACSHKLKQFFFFIWGK
jgi:hypothetical protein